MPRTCTKIYALSPTLFRDAERHCEEQAEAGKAAKIARDTKDVSSVRNAIAVEPK